MLFCGGALVTFDATSRSRGPRLSSINTDRGQAVASLARIESVDAATVLPGHGAAWYAGAGEAA